MSCFNSFDKMCKKIVCPTRHALNQSEMIERKFRKKISYEQIQIMNKQNNMLSVLVFPKDFENLPTVVYLHGNGGHKLECLQIAHGNFNLISFDFRACGKSQGEFITYGDQQVNDICCVVDTIKQKYGIKKIALWGRSMGASLALMYASLEPDQIYAMILDTPFRKLKKVVSNVAEHTRNNIPKFLVDIALFFVERKVQQITQVNVFDSDFMMHLNILNDIPILFAYSTEDSVVRQEDVKQLYNNYRGRKMIAQIQALHHQDRPKYFIEQGIQFVLEEGKNRTARSSASSKKGLSVSTRIPNQK